jgi:ubiquinone/menaquinone biosynthesis C-methylase UbiE
MSAQQALEDKLRQQFDHAPYPRIPIELSPKDRAGAYESFYLHSLVTSYYLRHRTVTQTNGKLILDAGCGSGYKSLVLAEANPNAMIVGVDLSEKSIELARERLKYHGFTNTEFYAMSIEELPRLGMEFDYINCDEVLYLVPEPVKTLQALRSVLKPEGCLRANLHSTYQREPYYRSQYLFQLMGLMEAGQEDFAYEVVVETLNSLKDNVSLKAQTWAEESCTVMDTEKLKERVFANQLLRGDKGFTVLDLFSMLEEAQLEFVSMVNWRHWDVADLFKAPDDIPALWGLSLSEASTAEKLHLYELLNPVHRLLDFWCAHPQPAPVRSVEQWEDYEWQAATIHLHPQLSTDELRQAVIESVMVGKPIEISRPIPTPALAPVVLESTMAACLLPLWEAPQPFQTMVDRYRTLKLVDPITLEPVSEADAFEATKNLLSRLEAFLYILVEPSA